MSTAEPLIRAPDPGPRTVRARRRLPGGRALVGALLVTLAAVGTFAAYAGADQMPRDEVLVLRRSVGAGQRLVADDARVALADIPDEVRAQVLQRPSQVDGAVALGPIAAGELVQRGAVLPPDETAAGSAPTFELSLPVESARALGGRLVRGELVDVLATYGSAESAYTSVVARRARVVDLVDTSSGVGADGLVVVHLALSSAEQMIATANAGAAASVALVRSTRAAEVPVPDHYRPDAVEGLAGR